MSTLIKPDYVKQTQTVNVTTIDHFLQAENIGKVGILKIDVEGFDLKVLKGARKALAAKNIEFILVECGFYNDNPHLISLDDFRDFLLPYGYRILGIYDQQLSWSGHKTLRYANVCFVAVDSAAA
jgi:hypothetical protein